MKEKGNNDLFKPEPAISLASFDDNSAILSRKCVYRAPASCTPVNVWLNSSLNCIQMIGKLEMKLSIAIMLSWPPSLIILFNGVLPC